MKLAFSTNAYTRYSLLEAMRGIKSAWYEGIEILADVPHAYPARLESDDVTTVRDELDRLGLQVSNINGNCSFGYWKDAPPEPYFEPSLISPDPRHREDRVQLILSTLQFAHHVGSANISITSGRMLGGMPPERAARQFAESIRPILDEADRLKVNVGIECEPGLFLEYVLELREWIDRLGHPRLGANLDIGHSQVIGESIPDVVRMLGNRIWNLHVEDIPGRKHYHMIPGEGSIDWIALRDALEEIRYDRFLTVELYTHSADPQSAAEKSIRFLRSRFGG
jgi:fructoselysine 3-epimerase